MDAQLTPPDDLIGGASGQPDMSPQPPSDLIGGNAGPPPDLQGPAPQAAPQDSDILTHPVAAAKSAFESINPKTGLTAEQEQALYGPEGPSSDLLKGAIGTVDVMGNVAQGGFEAVTRAIGATAGYLSEKFGMNPTDARKMARDMYGLSGAAAVVGGLEQRPGAPIPQAERPRPAEAAPVEAAGLRRPSGPAVEPRVPSYAPKPPDDLIPVAEPVEPPAKRPIPAIRPDVTDIDENGNIVKSGLPVPTARVAPAPTAEPAPPSPPLQLEDRGFRTTPGAIANEHAAEVSQLEAEGTQRAALETEGGQGQGPEPIQGFRDTRPLTTREGALVGKIQALAKQIAPGAQVDMYDRIRQGDGRINGVTYQNGLKQAIAWSLEGPHPEKTLHHEALHFLYRSGILTPEEWGTLQDASKKGDWVNHYDIPERYPHVPEAHMEESIAHAYADWAAGRMNPGGPVARTFAKIRNFLSRLKTRFRQTFGMKASAEDIFKGVESGEIGRRPPGKVPPEVSGAAAEAGPEGPPPEEPPDDEGGEEYVPKPSITGSLFGWIRGQEDELTRLRGNNEADRTEALNYIEGLPPALKDPDLNERIYHNLEEPGSEPMTLEEQALADRYITPIREEANAIYNRIRQAGIPIGMDGYVHRIAKGKGSMYDPQEGPPSADPFTGGRGLGQKTSSMEGRTMWMAEGPNGEKMIVNGPYKSGQKVTGEDGVTYRIRQATTKEIEEGSNVRYYKNAVANSLDNLLRLRRVERNINYLEQLKQDPTFFELGIPPGSQMQIPRGWKTTQLPQLRGWYMDPRIARMLDNFYETGPKGDLGQMMAKANRFLTQAIFLNPISALMGHGLNVATHWFVGRGADNFMPHTWARSAVNGFRAMRDVIQMNDKYQQLLREGNSLMYAPAMNRDFHQAMIKLMGGEIRKNPRTWGEIAKMAGTSVPHIYKALSNWSARGLWSANDMFMLQRVYDLMDKGHDMRSAIKEAEHEIPNYRIPSEAWDPEKAPGGAAFSELMSNPNLTIFGRYRYGLIHAYAETIGRLFSADKSMPLEKRAQAAGQLLALGVLFGVLYPAGDKVVQWALKNKHASLRRAGPTTVLAAVRGMMRGRPKGDTGEDMKNLMTGVSGLIGPAPASEAAVEALANTDLFTGKRIYNPNFDPRHPLNQAKELGYFAATRPYYGQQAEELATGRKKWPEIGASWLGINAPTQKEFALRKKYAQKDFKANVRAWQNKEKRLIHGLKQTYHNIFGFGGNE